MSKNAWTKVGFLSKTKRPDMLRGKIFIPEFNFEIDVMGFIRNPEQKRNADDPDIDIVFSNNPPPKS